MDINVEGRTVWFVLEAADVVGIFPTIVVIIN